MTTWPEVLAALVARDDLSADQAAWAMGEILAGEATPAQIAGFAVALRAKGETIEEVTGLVEAMYAARTPISIPGRLLDVVGTGGDRSMSVNISTMAAIVAAGAGAKVVKHGNRSASSQSGSADVLEALGIRLDLSPARVAEVAEEAGITFCFAAAFNPALRHTAVPRRELGIGTTFNFLGPLANPTRPAAQAIGCADSRMAPVMAGVFAARGVDAWVFRGDDGLDELTTTTTSSVWIVHEGQVTTATVDPSRPGPGDQHTRGAARRRHRPQRRRGPADARGRGGSGAGRGAAQRRRGAGRARGARESDRGVARRRARQGSGGGRLGGRGRDPRTLGRRDRPLTGGAQLPLVRPGPLSQTGRWARSPRRSSTPGVGKPAGRVVSPPNGAVRLTSRASRVGPSAAPGRRCGAAPSSPRDPRARRPAASPV